MAMTRRGLGAECSQSPRVPQTIHIGDDDDEEGGIADENMNQLQKMERAQKDFDKYMLLSPSSYSKAGKEDLLSEALSGFLGWAEGRSSGSSSDALRTEPYSRMVPATPTATAVPTTPTRGQPDVPCDGTLQDPVDAFEDEDMTVDGGEAKAAEDEAFTPQKRPRNTEEEKKRLPDEKEEKVDSIPDARGFLSSPSLATSFPLMLPLDFILLNHLQLFPRPLRPRRTTPTRSSPSCPLRSRTSSAASSPSCSDR